MSTTVANDPRAHELLRAARATTYHFPEGFAGFTATIDVADSALDAFSGTVDISGPRDITVTIDGPDDLVSWAQQQVASMVAHRWSVPYEEADGRWELTLDPETDHVQGQRVNVSDKFRSWYRVRDSRITQVNREMGATRFVITMQEQALARDARFLPSTFTVSYWDTEAGRLTKVESYTDTFEVVEGIHIPASRRIDTASDEGLRSRTLAFSSIALQATP